MCRFVFASHGMSHYISWSTHFHLKQPIAYQAAHFACAHLGNWTIFEIYCTMAHSLSMSIDHDLLNVRKSAWLHFFFGIQFSEINDLATCFSWSSSLITCFAWNSNKSWAVAIAELVVKVTMDYMARRLCNQPVEWKSQCFELYECNVYNIQEIDSFSSHWQASKSNARHEIDHYAVDWFEERLTFCIHKTISTIPTKQVHIRARYTPNSTGFRVC